MKFRAKSFLSLGGFELEFIKFGAWMNEVLR